MNRDPRMTKNLLLQLEILRSSVCEDVDEGGRKRAFQGSLDSWNTEFSLFWSSNEIFISKLYCYVFRSSHTDMKLHFL